MDLSKVFCIENKSNHTFEQDATIVFETLKTVDNSLLSSCYVVQPSEYDITNEMYQYFAENNINFEKILLFNPQKDISTNYTNVPVVLDYMRHQIKTEYIMFTDLDVVYLNNLELPETNKCYLTILEPERTDQFVHGEFEMDVIYRKYSKEHLNYEVDGITKFVNTWFIFAKTSHFFWQMYKKVTFDLLEIAKNIDYEDIEIRCEEIAASIIYEMHPDDFLDISCLGNKVSFQESVHFFKDTYPCNIHTSIYHYNSINKFYKTTDYPINNLYPIFKAFASQFGVKNTLDGLKLNLSDIIRK